MQFLRRIEATQHSLCTQVVQACFQSADLALHIGDPGPDRKGLPGMRDDARSRGKALTLSRCVGGPSLCENMGLDKPLGSWNHAQNSFDQRKP